MNTANHEFRQQFLMQACRYLFGPAANCETLRRLGFGLPALQAVPADRRERRG